MPVYYPSEEVSMVVHVYIDAIVDISDISSRRKRIQSYLLRMYEVLCLSESLA